MAARGDAVPAGGTPAFNALGQPVGAPVPGWTARPRPPASPIIGRHCRLERLDPAAHSDDLFAADSADATGASWTYLPYGPFPDAAGHRAWLQQVAAGADPMFFAVVDLATGRPVGQASYLRIAPEAGSIEVGHLHFSPLLQRSWAGTEAMYLMMRRAFDQLGYRRYEWKCDALNAPSRAAAARLGFTYEGTFRQMMVTKGRNRDVAWFSVLDGEWPALRAAFEAWLAPANVDANGRPRRRLAELRRDASTSDDRPPSRPSPTTD